MLKTRRGSGNKANGYLRRSRLLAATFAVAIATIGGTAAIVTSAEATATPTTRLVPGFLTALSRATFIKEASSAELMNVGVGVQLPDPTAEHNFYNELYDPASPEFHHFLTPAQFNTKFGVPAATVAAVRSYLTSTGATITYASDSGDYFMVSATVAQVQKLFNVKIGEYSYDHADFIANNKPASVPTALPILGTLGLNTYNKMALAPLTGHRLAAAEKSEQKEIATGRRVIAKDAAAARAATAGRSSPSAARSQPGGG